MNARKTAPFILMVILLAACASAPAGDAVVVDVEYGSLEEPVAPPLAFEPMPTALATQGMVEHPPVPPQDNTFEDYGQYPFTDAYEDHLSTFSIDVDTASYTVARRYVQDGMLPPAAAVRPEEFINYFDQDYPVPPDVAFGIYADGAPSPFDPPGIYLLRIGIQGYEVPEWDRKPAALTFVIDVSGSMDRENRLGLVKRSLQLLVNRLRPDDTVAVVVYGSQARVVLPPTPGSERSLILDAIYSLEPEGSTNAEAGLQLGYRLAWDSFKADGINRVVLCSDGVANVGATGPEEILESIRGYADAGITLTSVGFGMGNFNDVLMEQLADNGDGHYAYVDDLAEARKLFVEDLTSTLQVIALDARVQVDFNSDVVTRYRLIGYENRDLADHDFRNDGVDAGEIGAGHSVTALYALHLAAGAEGRLATVQLRWQDPDTREVIEINGNVNTWDLAGHFRETSTRFQLTAVTAQYAEVLRHSPWAQDTTLEELASHARRLATELPWDEDVVEFSELVAQASQAMAMEN
jgi:Ca-activated chloride channel family protein